MMNPAFMGLSAYDPSGIDQMQRARATRDRFKQEQFDEDYRSPAAGGYVPGQILNQAVHAQGPLPDPKWEGYFQAVDDASGGARTRFGYMDQPAPDLTREPEWGAGVAREMPLPLTSLPRSQQIGTPLDGLRQARPQKRFGQR